MGVIHSFANSLNMSHSAADLPFWNEIYEKAFPGGVAVDHRRDGEHQRAGIDRSIVMPNSKQILIDEKVRFASENGTVYEDIALEYWSDFGRQIPGWVCKPLRADFIAYAIAPVGRCYLLPVLPLQAAWSNNCEDWKMKFGERTALNSGWITKFCPVPVSVLFPAIGSCLRIAFTPIYR